MKRGLPYLLSMLWLCVGCTDPSPVPPICQLAKDTYTSSGLAYERVYAYEGGMLKSMTYTSTTSPSANYVSTFHYAGGGHLDSIVSVGGLGTVVVVYTYDNSGRISRVASNTGDTTDYEYNNLGQVAKKYFDRYPNDYTVEYIYTDINSNSNYSQSIQTNNGGIQITSKFKYDNAPNPLYRSPIWTDDYFADTPNNIVEVETTISGTTSTTSYTYTYDAKGYPQSRTQSNNGNKATLEVSCR